MHKWRARERNYISSTAVKKKGLGLCVSILKNNHIQQKVFIGRKKGSYDVYMCVSVSDVYMLE